LPHEFIESYTERTKTGKHKGVGKDRESQNVGRKIRTFQKEE
jgi:hypothetical protein